MSDLRYVITSRRRLADIVPMLEGDNPLLWNPDTREWHDGGRLTQHEVTLGKHITEQEAEHIMETGALARERVQDADV